MNNINYNIQFNKLCDFLELGECITKPVTVAGGFLHKMYALETTKGKFAVKVLNPQIMLRPNVLKNINNSEKIAFISSKKIPALTALNINNCVVHFIDGQYYMVFNWIDGVSLDLDEITKEHSSIMGNLLGNIHNTDFSELEIEKPNQVDNQAIDWEYYYNLGKEKSIKWVSYLFENIDNLYLWNKRSLEADKILRLDMVLSHRDMDSKNVLWNKGKPIIIDWESAGYVNPFQELIELLIYWSEDSKGNLDKERFLSLLNGYKNVRNVTNVNWTVVLNSGYIGKLEWPEYSLKRSLGIECTDKNEQQLGTSQVILTIESLISYANLIPFLGEWLSERGYNYEIATNKKCNSKD